MSPPFSAMKADSKCGGDGAVDLRHAVDRLAHQPAAIDGEHDVVVLLDAEFARQKLAVAGAALPVDHAPAHAGLVVLQRLELAALAGAALRMAVGQRLALQKRDRLVAGAADIGQHRHLACPSAARPGSRPARTVRASAATGGRNWQCRAAAPGICRSSDAAVPGSEPARRRCRRAAPAASSWPTRACTRARPAGKAGGD